MQVSYSPLFHGQDRPIINFAFYCPPQTNYALSLTTLKRKYFLFSIKPNQSFYCGVCFLSFISSVIQVSLLDDRAFVMPPEF